MPSKFKIFTQPIQVLGYCHNMKNVPFILVSLEDQACSQTEMRLDFSLDPKIHCKKCSELTSGNVYCVPREKKNTTVIVISLIIHNEKCKNNEHLLNISKSDTDFIYFLQFARPK